VVTALRRHALGFPGAWEDTPWDDSPVTKVGKKVFVFWGADSLTVKLPVSQEAARAIPGAEPAGYGLGRHGWINVPTAEVPRDLLEEWLEESYRAVAPKRLAAQLDT
jgi:predicted DNA-binding protein (MmcQ/YjbR family)